MKLKKKIIPNHVIKPTVPEEKKEQPRAKLIRLAQFSREISQVNPNHMFGFIRQWFEELFNEYPEPTVHLELAKLRIQYELIRLDHEEQGVPLPERVRQNCIASKHYDVERLTPSLKMIMEPILKSIQNQKGEFEMPTKKADQIVNRIKQHTSKIEKSKNLNKETVTQTYVRLFQENATKKLTDIQLAAEMCSAHPDKKKYTPEDINTIRNMYNRGKLSIQNNKPPLHMCEKIENKLIEKAGTKKPVAKKK